LPAPVQSGDVLAGKYRVERVLGEGGMGVVVAATHTTLDQKVALKFLLPEAVANPEALARFLREARLAVRLKSEHVARIIDVGTLDNGAPYIVMEYLAGTDLAGWIERERTLSIAVAVDFILQACDAIAEAHSLGIVHRDLKPQNLFITRAHDGTDLVKVLDFGISKSMMGGDAIATATHTVMGSPAYMSPEQMRSAKLVDQRTDIWALGVILYQILVGKTPWAGDTFTDLAFKVAMDPLPPLPGSVGRPRGFDAVIQRCLEKDPAQRYPSIAALAAALAPFGPPHAKALVERIARIGRGDATPTSTTPGRPSAIAATLAPLASSTVGGAAGESMKLPPRRRKRTLAIALAAGAVIAGVAVFAVSSGGSDDAATPARDVDPAMQTSAHPTTPPPVAPTPAAQAPATPPAVAPEATPPLDAGSIPTDAAGTSPRVTTAVHPPSQPVRTRPASAQPPPPANANHPPPPTHPASQPAGSAQAPGGKLPDF
jgi:serine/threonine protein kinase